LNASRAAEPLRVAVVGGGISGLAVAHALLRRARAADRPLDLRLYEAAQRLGGKISTERRDGWVTEGGPDSFLLAKPAALALCRELGLGDRLIPTNAAARTVYVYSGGRLKPLPGGVRLTAPTAWGPFLRSDLISWPGKLRMAMDLILPAAKVSGDESIGAFVRRRLGREALDKLAEPMMAGIYMGDPDRLSLRGTFPQLAELEQRHGSVIRGLRRGAREARARASAAEGPLAGSVFFSLRGGSGELVEALAQAIGPAVIHLGQAVRAVEPLAEPGGSAAGGSPTYRLSLPEAREWTADRLILAGPASASAALLAPWAPDLAAEIRSIPHCSSALVNLGYDASAIRRPLDGYGYVVAAGENHPIRACSWSSTKLEGRAPVGKVLLRAFFGGAGFEEETRLPDEELVARAQDAWVSVLGLRGEPELVRVQRWPEGNPQVAPGHQERMARLEAGLPAGLSLLGAAFHGVGVPDCVRAAETCAAALLPDQKA
jgi:oxygen-dependent protoporphyrinogen oxidase